MKRNSLSTKLFAMLLCVVMVVGCLPLSAFATDWEGDIDLAPEGLNPENPIFLDLIYQWDNEETQEGLQVMFYNTDAEFDPTYFVTYGMPGQYSFSVTGEGDFSVTIDGEEIAAVEGVATKEITLTRGDGFNFAIDAGEGYYIEFLPVETTPPVGADFENAAILVEGANEATTLLSRMGEGMYYYKWTAPSDGVLTLSFNSYAPNAVFANVEVQYPVFSGLTEFDDGTMEIDVTEGTEYGLIVLVVTDDRSTSEFSIQADFEETPTGPIVDEDLKFQTIGVSFQDYVGIQCILNKNATAIKDKGYDNFYVVATQDVWNSDGTFTEKDADMAVVDYGTRMKFDIQIVSWAMTETVHVTLYAEKDGVVYVGEQFTTSVEELALEKIASYELSNDSVRCTAFVDMLNFGAAVQTSYSHNAENPANRKLEELGFAKWATVDEPAFEKENSNTEAGAVLVQQAAISLQEKAELQFIFRVDISNYELRYTVGGKTTTITSDQFEAMSAVITKINIGVRASNFRDEFTVALYDPATGEPVTAIYTVSVEAYAKNNLNGTKRDAYIALMKYGDAVSKI